jgi:hypothetical protein
MFGAWCSWTKWVDGVQDYCMTFGALDAWNGDNVG